MIIYPIELSCRFINLALKLMQELTVERPPRMRMEGKRGWMVEYFKDDQEQCRVNSNS